MISNLDTKTTECKKIILPKNLKRKEKEKIKHFIAVPK